ncbi:mycofactocin precursor MftA [Streptomyces canus]
MNEFDPARDEPSPDRGTDATDEAPIEADELVEEVSIDGMCGVY